MRGLIRACVFATLLGNGLFLLGCSQRDPALLEPASEQSARIPVSSTDARTSKANVPTGDPCALLIDDEVNKVFPGAAPGKRNRSLDGHGIRTCVWDTPTDRFAVQVFDAKSGSVEDELRSRISGSIDPTMARAASEVRYETISGIGDEAMLALEKADLKRGILADTAVLVTQRGERRAVLFTGSSLAASDRASALEALKTLGKKLAERL